MWAINKINSILHNFNIIGPSIRQVNFSQFGRQDFHRKE